MPAAKNYTPQPVQSFLRQTNSIITAFVERKLALAAQALLRRGASYNQIAEELELSSGDAVCMMIHRWGRKEVK